jgi:hypothetical protein
MAGGGVKYTAEAVRTRATRILKLVEAIGEDPRNEGVFMLVECGLHSGFPVCCIEFFVKAYWPIMTSGSPRRSTARRAMERYRMSLRNNDNVTPGWVPCPRCLQDRRVIRVRDCDWHLTTRERRHAIRIAR